MPEYERKAFMLGKLKSDSYEEFGKEENRD